MNRYQRAIPALEYRDKTGCSYKVAAKKFDIHRPQLVSNLKFMRDARPDLYDNIKSGTMSFNKAEKIYKLER